jgi:hypothetical protein
MGERQNRAYFSGYCQINYHRFQTRIARNIISVKIITFLVFLLFPVTCFAFEINSFQKSEKPGLNLAFVPYNYQDNDEFISDVSIIRGKLKNIPPFSQYQANINLTLLDISPEEEKVFFKETSGFPPLMVRSDFLINIRNRLGADYKLAIINKTGFSSCAELSDKSEISLLIIGKARYNNAESFSKSFLHELGHSLGLRDECVNCPQICQPGPPNCARNMEEAKSLWQDLVNEEGLADYVQGCCGNINYIRPTIASLMNDIEKAETFGRVNERYLRQVLEKNLKPEN